MQLIHRSSSLWAGRWRCCGHAELRVMVAAPRETEALRHYRSPGQARVRSVVVAGDARNPHQDAGFAVQQLTELAVRALSPGTNDPYTAINAVDDLSAGLSLLASRKMPSPARFEEQHVVRVHAPYPDVVTVTSSVLDNLRWYASGSPSVMHVALTLVERVGDRAGEGPLRAALRGHVPLLAEAFRAAGHQPRHLEVFLPEPSTSPRPWPKGRHTRSPSSAPAHPGGDTGLFGCVPAVGRAAQESNVLPRAGRRPPAGRRTAVGAHRSAGQRPPRCAPPRAWS
ncbi:DUF2254 family protein [Georgenia sp. AZ-5]|uniref:DUF2254 family protein n=1 Tax=Georgenia sp. AZ-5 TaxID=3367526 RepID=UPI0037549544